MKNPKIRNARPADVDAMTRLLATLFSIEADFQADPERQRRGLEKFLDGCGKHRCLKVAESAGEVIGMGSAQILISTAEGGAAAMVEDLVVDAPYRRKGIGKLLLSSIEVWAGERGIRRLQLLADRENPTGIDFYRHNAWHETRLVCLRKYCRAPE